jgi:hypothetical protein
MAIGSIKDSMNNMEKSLDNSENFKRFYWSPDYKVVGFATPVNIENA